MDITRAFKILALPNHVIQIATVCVAQNKMYTSLVLKSAIFENGNYQHFFAGEFAQGSRVRKGDLAKYWSFLENWVRYKAK